MKVPAARPYQKKGIDLTRKAFMDGFKKILFWLATGGGKSIIFLTLIASMLEKKKKVLFLVKRKQLVFQTERHFKKCGIDCSVLIANYAGFDPSKPLQIASIDTIARRDIKFLAFLMGFDIVVVDEAHDATSPSYQDFLKVCEETFGIKTFIGLTATPFPIGKKVHDFWQCCVKPIEMHELRDLSFLVPVDLYRPSAEYDFSQLKVDTKTGDFKTKMTSQMMADLVIIGDVIKEYQEKGEGKTAICFCVDKDHSIAQAYAFNQAGIMAVHCDESTPQKERDKSIALLQKYAREGIPFVLCNVNIFSTGVDIPEAEIGIMARPTMSEVLYIQQVGRLLRPYRRCGKCGLGYDNSEKCYHCGYDRPSYIKHKAVILDHGDNTSRFDEPYKVRYAVLKKEDLRKKSDEEKIILFKTCSKCFRTYSILESKCPNPACQSVETKEKFHKTEAGELRPYDEYELMKNFYQQVTTTKNLHNFKESFIHFKMYERFGDTVMKYKTEFKIPTWIPKVVKKQKEEKLSGKVYSGDSDISDPKPVSFQHVRL